MLLEHEGFPVLELKWNIIKRKFSTEKHFKRLRADYQKQQAGYEISPWKVPEEWYDLFQSHDLTGFQWEGNLFAGKGLIIFCKDCQCATLLQFYERRYIPNETLNSSYQRDILSSFQDHTANGSFLWSVFDVRITLPKHFRLLRHVFSPGAFEFMFETGAYRISLHRWSPASVILIETSLQDFAEKLFSFKSNRLMSEIVEGFQTVELESLPSHSLWVKWRQKFHKEPEFKWARVWHVSDANRILAVKAESDKPLDVDSLHSICSDYVIV